MTDQPQPPVKFYLAEMTYGPDNELLFDVLRGRGPHFSHVEFDTHEAALAGATKAAFKYPDGRFAVIQMHEAAANEGGQINVHDASGELV